MTRVFFTRQGRGQFGVAKSFMPPSAGPWNPSAINLPDPLVIKGVGLSLAEAALTSTLKGTDRMTAAIDPKGEHTVIGGFPATERAEYSHLENVAFLPIYPGGPLYTLRQFDTPFIFRQNAGDRILLPCFQLLDGATNIPYRLGLQIMFEAPDGYVRPPLYNFVGSNDCLYVEVDDTTNIFFDRAYMGHGSPHAMTTVGDATIGTWNPFSGLASYKSLQLNGAGGLSIASSIDFAPGILDANPTNSAHGFTFDWFMQLDELPSAGNIFTVLTKRVADELNMPFHFHVDADGQLFASLTSNAPGAARDLAFNKLIGTLATGTPYHVMCGRQGDTFYTALAGQVNTPWSAPGAGLALRNTSAPILVGHQNGPASGMKGKIAGLRFTDLICRWISNFTPPTIPPY